MQKLICIFLLAVIFISCDSKSEIIPETTEGDSVNTDVKGVQ